MEKIIKVKFSNSNEVEDANIKSFEQEYFGIKQNYDIVEVHVQFDELMDIISKVQSAIGLGSLLYKEALDGINYLGQKVEFDTYNVYTECGKLYKYKFDSNFIPLKSTILSKKRNDILDLLL
jgi:hypothetical protein